MKSKTDDTNNSLNLMFSGLKPALSEFFPKEAEKVRESILKTSDQFLFKENKSQWAEDWFKIGYLNYFFPMQVTRLTKAFSKILEVTPNIFNQVSKVIDFGAGPGPALFALQSLKKEGIPPWLHIDESEEANELARKIYSHFHIESLIDFKKLDKIPLSKKENELLLMSYSLCEGIDNENIFSYDHILILEPSLKKQSRELIELRGEALGQSYNVLAPCSHAMTCPMIQKKSDWCHDKVDKPSFDHLADIKLPFSENTLNFSYLFLSKKISPSAQGKARVIGDFQKEKGKTKVAICQNDQRLFLSWLKRSQYTPNFGRGDLIEIPDNALIKGQEIRISAD